MTFKHKLSARLARLWLGLPLSLLALASCNVRARTVGEPPQQDVIDRLQVSPPVVTLAANQMTDFVAVGITATGDTAQSAVSWSVSGGVLVQTIDNGGQHVGRYQAGPQPGSFRVIAMAQSGAEQTSDTANVIVTTIPVASVVVSPAVVALDVGQTSQFAATPQDANGAPLTGRAISWTSGNTAVATVSTSGMVTAKAAGSATVTATSEGKSGSASITVTQVPVASVDVTPASASLAPGGTVQLTAVARDGSGGALSGRPISWSTSNAQVATVGAGLVTSVAAGTAQIVASVEGKSDTATITVAVIPVASVEVTPAAADVAVGSTVRLTPVAKDAAGAILSGRLMTWSTSSAQIATVAAGLVTGVAAGTAYIVVTSEGKSDTATITVTFAPVASVTVSPDATNVAVNGDAQFTAVVKDAAGNVLSGRTVTWSSSNTAVATVSASGLARGVSTGTTTITALSEGISGNASLTVVTLPPVGQCGAWPAGITQWVLPLPVSTGQAFYASPNGSDANPGTLAAPWRSVTKANSLQPGQILYLRAGVYGARGTTGLDFSARGTATAPITLSGYPGDARPLIQGRMYMSGDYLRLTNVVIDGPTGDVGGPGPGGEAITIVLKGSYVELSNSEVRFDQWHAGVGVDGADHYIVMNNYIHDNGGYLGDYSTSDAQWNTSHGMYNSPSSYGLVANNVIEHNDAKGLMGRHDANHIIVVNNTVVANGRFGIDVAESTHDWILANNILLNNGTIKGGGGIGTPGSGGASYVEINNMFWNNGTNGTTTWDNNATIINNVVADPMLVNPAVATDRQNPNPNTDNQLRAGSPAIGFAALNYAVPFDITGKCRGASPDAGAYER
jgi:uncharacterized protein YjdB